MTRGSPSTSDASAEPSTGPSVSPESSAATTAGSTPSRAKRIQRRYGAWSRVYDWFARATASVGGVRVGCVRALDLDSGDTVVEFGCGPGVNLPALREAVGSSGRVVGVDLTGPMLDRARRLVERRGWTNVSLVRGDATTPPVDRADAVLATFVTSLFPDPHAAVSDWCALADTVVVAGFAPAGGRFANALLRAFVGLNAELFDVGSGSSLSQLAERSAASRRALADNMAVLDREEYLLQTIVVHVGHASASRRNNL